MSSNTQGDNAAAMMELLTSRASAARMIDPAPTSEEIEAILKAAVSAADHGRIRPWRFIVMQGGGRLRLANLMAEAVRANDPGVSESELEKVRAKALRAPVIIAVIAKPVIGHKVPVIEQSMAAAAAGAHLMLAANTLGYGAAWKTGAPAYSPLVREGLGFGDDDSIIGFFYIGTDSKGTAPAPRATLEGVVEYWLD